MKLEQFFYGRGVDGYGILSSSVLSCGLTDQVVLLCQTPGTPTVASDADDKPFLLQKVVGDAVLMACGRSGHPDEIGRRTSFFHVLVAQLYDVKSFQISVADLFENEIFATVCDSSPKIEPLTVDPQRWKIRRKEPSTIQLPAIVLCQRADNLSLVDLLGGDLVGKDFATISWNMIPGFKVYGLSAPFGMSKIPGSFTVYDSKGRVLRHRGSGDLRGAAQSAHGFPKKDVKNSSWAKSSYVPLIMTGVFCWLIGTFTGYRFNSSRVSSVTNSKEALVSKSEMDAAIDMRDSCIKQLEETCSQLRASKPKLPEFNQLYRIKSVDEIRSHKYYNPARRAAKQGDAKAREALILYDKMGKYVEFVERVYSSNGGKKGE